VCGIAGKLWFDETRPGDEAAVAAITAALTHRGPDDAGLVASGPVALGHRRLSIVDLGPRGRQPMASTDGACLAVVNGEIYNHADLRAELTRRGHRFRSDCDSEIVLPLYREFWHREGPDCLDRLEGMFAFALWDGEARRLVLARDRTGQKPVVYAHTPEGLSFASELGALARDPDLDRTPDDQALADYLAFRCVPHPRTAWRGARKLPPAHALVAEGGEVRLARYWRLPPGPEHATAPTFEEAAEEIAARLATAVRRRLMSDVPVGALLSGGLDSAAVVGLMARESGATVRTFTIGFDDPAYDETAGARKVARLFGTEHHERIVRPDALAVLDALVDHHGEPFADSSSIPTFLVSQLASEHVKVVLTGDGGDESFAGYDRYRALALADRLARPSAAPARLALAAACRLATATGAGGHRSLGTRLERFRRAARAAPRRRNHLWRLATAPSLLDRLLTAEGRERLGHSSHYGPDLPGPLPLNEALVLDVERYLPDDLLVKLDVASMAHSLEARSPFLDRELMEAASALPASYKLAGGTTKRVLRRAVGRLLPPDVVDGPKRGFGIPLDAWFRGPLLDHAREVLTSSAARRRGLFDVDRVGRLVEDHARAEVAAHETRYTLLVLERWFLKSESAPPATRRDAIP